MGSSSKGGGSSQSLYYGTIAGELGVGPGYSLEWINVNGIKAFTNPILKPTGADYSDITLQGFGQARFYWGTETQMPDPVLNSYREEPAHRGKVYIVLIDCCFGQNGETNAPTIEVGWRRKPQQSVVTGGPAEQDNNFTANPIAVGAEWLTGWDWANLPGTELNVSTFQAAAEGIQSVLAAGMSRPVASVAPLINEQTDLRTALAELASVSQAWFRYGANGKIEAGFWPRSADLGAVCALTEDDCTEEPDIEIGEWHTLPNSVAVEFRDYSKHHKTNYVIKNNLAAIRNDPNGQLRRTTARRRMLNNIEQAGLHGADLLREVSLPPCTVRLSVRRAKAKNPGGTALRPGDYFTFPVRLLPTLPLETRLFRCMRREFDTTGPIMIQGEMEMNGAVQSAGSYAASSQSPGIVPPVNYRRVLAMAPDLVDDLPPVYAFAARPDNMAIGFQLAYGQSAGGDKVVVGTQSGFALPLHLALGLSAGASTIRVKLIPTGGTGVNARRDAAQLQNWQGGLLEARDDELLVVVMAKNGSGVVTAFEALSVSGPPTIVATDTYDVPVLRARRGTTAQAFNSGSFPDAWSNYEVWLVDRDVLTPMTHGDFLGLFGSGSAVYFEWIPFGGEGGFYDPNAAYNERQRRVTNSIAVAEFGIQTTTDRVPVDSYTFPAEIYPPLFSGTLGYLAQAFVRSTTGTPATPTGGSYNDPIPAGWHAGTPAGTGPVYITQRFFTPDGAGDDPVWSTPVKLEGVDGDDGASAKLVVLTSDSQAFKIAKSGTISPSVITFTAYGQNVAGSTVFTIASGSATLTGGGAVRQLTPENMASDAVTVKVAWDGQEDYISVVKINEGADSVTAMLTNEAHTLSADADGNVLSFSGADTLIKIYVGVTDDTANWSFSKTDSGCTSTRTGNLIEVTALSADTAYVDITATRSGYPTQTKRFSLAKSRTGQQGAPGTGGGTQAPEPELSAYLDVDNGNIPVIEVTSPSGAPTGYTVYYKYVQGVWGTARYFPFTLDASGNQSFNLEIRGEAQGCTPSGWKIESFNSIFL